jgi:hypothetical protein
MALLTQSSASPTGMKPPPVLVPRFVPGAWIRKPLLLIVSLLAFAFHLSEARAQSSPSREYQLKAVFLFNFIQFVQWPDAVFPEPGTPIRIGVLGDDPFGQALDEAVRDETVRGHKLVVLRSRRLEDLQDCHLLFIGKSEARRIGEILALIDRRPVLTVGETDGFARNGGIIAFFSEGNKVRFEINPVSAQRQGLKLSSQLLGLGRIVAADAPQGGP